MRSSWSKIPMLRVAIALISGIGLAMIFNQEQLKLVWIWIFAVLMICSLASAIVFNHLKNISFTYKYKAWSGLAVTLSIFAAGYLLAVFHIQKNYAGDFCHFLSQENQLIAQIDEPPVLRDKIVMANAKVQEIKSGEQIICTTGRLQLDIIKDSLSEHLQYGDVILVQSKIEPVEGPKNPDEFNYKRYLNFQNIYYKAFLNPGSWKPLKQGQGNPLLAFIFHVRDNFLLVIKKYVTDKNDFGVASAIMLGYRDYINGDIMRAYASSGTIHVLSVSGLHVGIIFIMLNFLLQWMDARGRKAEITKAVIVITFIWFYACLTGMSPPVLRSAIMFSLIQLGKVLIRNVNMYNIVAGSAILLLLYDPFVLADVGFQLSYIAVFGIIYLQPKIYALLTLNIPERVSGKATNFGNKLITFFKHDIKWFGMWALDWCWQLTAVSLAAQIATLPLILLYF
jgi:competence protein ComEC